MYLCVCMYVCTYVCINLRLDPTVVIHFRCIKPNKCMYVLQLGPQRWSDEQGEAKEEELRDGAEGEEVGGQQDSQVQ